MAPFNIRRLGLPPATPTSNGKISSRLQQQQKNPIKAEAAALPELPLYRYLPLTMSALSLRRCLCMCVSYRRRLDNAAGFSAGSDEGTMWRRGH